jgi:hypothetical protein
MFSGLNKILDRNFVVGFALPAILFMFLASYIAKLFSLLPSYPDLRGKDAFADTTLFAMITLGLALVLMVLNWNILRILEGYWYWDLGRKVNGYFVKRWNALSETIAELQSRRKQQGAAFGEMRELMRAQEEFAERFPLKATAVLPTKFGNALHAFEDYPRQAYEIDSIPGWSRLLAVVPKDYRELIEESRGDMNFWMNTWFLSYFLLAEYLGLAAWFRETPLVWLVIPALIFAIFFCSEQATKAAVAWGHWVKGAFDVFLLDLLKKLGYKTPLTLAAVREICKKLSQSMIYRTATPLMETEKHRDGYEPPPVLILLDGKTSEKAVSDRH